MPRKTTVNIVPTVEVPTVQAAIIPDVQSLRIAELECQVEALTLKLAKSIQPEKVESDYASVVGQLKAKMKGKRGFALLSVSLKNDCLTEKATQSLEGLSDREKKVLSFVSKVGKAYITLQNGLATWNTGTSMKETER
jgi:hypothetical protein